ncbi:hypothetical protein [Okeania sp.]|uniref:hypothetical protein n=1 Tax=Okeania sp. TaxID=3100323 RepID=UPI002B4B012B|nr:hypothetical protein [Okeania sp.]MEB3342779.1 hypothetical protein [Okeania sp.]
MLERFRAFYPTGCLISELITIHNGKYVVRVLVQVNGETLATGLGSADTVELAEDKARERSLATLKFDTSFSGPQTSIVSPPSSTTSIPDTNSVNTPLPTKTEKLAKAKTGLNIDLKEVSDTSTVSSALEKKEISTGLKKDEFITVDSNINSEISTGLKKDEFITTKSSSIDDDHVSDSVQQGLSEFDDSWLDASYSQEKEKIDEVGKNIIDYTSHLANEITKSEPINSEINLTESISSNNKVSASDLSQDVSDDNVNIDILMDSLGWTKENERDFLEQNYGQKTRQFLTSEELSDFCEYLDILQRVTKEIKSQGWKAKQQKDYFQYNHNKDSLEQLSIDELQSFLQYLEVFVKTTNEIKRLGWNATKGKTFLKQNYGEEGRTRLSFEKLQHFLQHLEGL